MRNFLVLSAIALLGCSESQPGDTDSSVSMIPQDAKLAIVQYLREHPDEFVGSPNPDRFLEMELTDLGDGCFGLGAFTLCPARGTYSASIGIDSPEPFLYEGRLIIENGKVIATKPSVKRFHVGPASSIPNVEVHAPSESQWEIEIKDDGRVFLDGVERSRAEIIARLRQVPDFTKLDVVLTASKDQKVEQIQSLQSELTDAVPELQAIYVRVSE